MNILPSQPFNASVIDQDPKLRLPRPVLSGEKFAGPKLVLPAGSAAQARQATPLGERLIEAGLLRVDQLESALEHQKVEKEREKRRRQRLQQAAASSPHRPILPHS